LLCHVTRIPIFHAITLERDVVRLINGQESVREIIKVPPAIAVVAIHDENILLVRQYRYALSSSLLELPAGRLNENEVPITCAQRELREETGYSGNLASLGSYYMAPGYSDEIIHYFWSKDLIWDPLPLDEGEFLKVETIPWQKAVEMTKRGEFQDAKTIMGILLVLAIKI
jgi:ADP-ribose pyrophosphatase